MQTESACIHKIRATPNLECRGAIVTIRCKPREKKWLPSVEKRRKEQGQE